MNIKNEEKAKEIVLDIGRKLCSLIGWKEAIGQVFALLYISKDPLSLDDIAEQVNLSKSNVWGIIQQLQRLGAVNKAWATQNRKDFYIAEKDFDLILTRGVLPLLKSKVAMLSSYLENAQKELSNLKEKPGEATENQVSNYENMIGEITKQKNRIEVYVNMASNLGGG